jgi:hypothetical protein
VGWLGGKWQDARRTKTTSNAQEQSYANNRAKREEELKERLKLEEEQLAIDKQKVSQLLCIYRKPD